MGYYSYKIEHDFGLAPNPFGKYCTLAICKGDIRRNKRLKVGDWIFGTGSAKLKNVGYLIYAMQVLERLKFEEYWNDPRFQYKKPVLNGSIVQLYGDNIYHKNDSGAWIQEDSAHSLVEGKENTGHLKADTKGEYVLISKQFYYFGDQAVKIPEEFLEVCSNGRNVKSIAIPEDVANAFVIWLKEQFTKGIQQGANPINWKKYKQ